MRAFDILWPRYRIIFLPFNRNSRERHSYPDPGQLARLGHVSTDSNTLLWEKQTDTVMGPVCTSCSSSFVCRISHQIRTWKYLDENSQIEWFLMGIHWTGLHIQHTLNYEYLMYSIFPEYVFLTMMDHRVGFPLELGLVHAPHRNFLLRVSFHTIPSRKDLQRS